MFLLFLALFALGIVVLEAFKTFRIYQNQKKFCCAHGIDISHLPNPFFSFIKRLVDISVSLIVCLTLLPLLYLVFAPIICLTSKGPAIFRQERIGIFDSRFTCYKFRSMVLNNDETVACPNDKRVTKVGRLIRKTHIDEFPQFFNVLIGDMSLVGPRPYSISAAVRLQQSEHYFERLLIRPGLTGLAQIHSNRTLTHNQTIFFDLTYLEQMSCKKDIYIFFETLKFKDITY